MPNFDGEKGQLVEQWLTKVDATFRVIRAPEDRKIALVQSKLQGYAYTFFSTEEEAHPEMTYVEFRVKLRERYFPSALRRARETEV